MNLNRSTTADLTTDPRFWVGAVIGSCLSVKRIYNNQINNKMDYKEKIKSAIERAQENLAFDIKVRDEANAAFKKREKEEEEPIRLLIQQYLDEELKDCNGNTIREGYVIATKDNYPAYKVLKRGMQFVFGTPMFNPSVEVVTYSPSKRLGKKTKTLHRSELKELQIMFEDVAV